MGICALPVYLALPGSEESATRREGAPRRQRIKNEGAESDFQMKISRLSGSSEGWKFQNLLTGASTFRTPIYRIFLTQVRQAFSRQ